MTVRAVNIGGGPKFKAHGWANFDGVAGFTFSPTCQFPIADKSLDLVYSSHTLEHLDDATVTRVLREAHRMLKPLGELVIKIPDFDAILAAYHNGDADYFARWPNIRTMTETVANRGVADTITARAAQCFCGFWNSAFGHMFAGYDLKRPGAYYGPPVMSGAKLHMVMELQSPHLIASVLRSHVIDYEADYTFNHQNAWGRAEFITTLAVNGFIVTETERERAIAIHRDIPGIEDHQGISAYYVASPC